MEQNTITYNAAISACNWFCIRFPWSCWIPPKILQRRSGLPYCLITITVILFFFSRDTFLTLPMAHVTHYWRYQATVRPPRHSGERGSQWPAALELLFSEMPMVSVERNIITFSAAISVFPDKMLGGDWRLERIHIVVAHLHRNLSNDFWLKGNLRKDRVSKSPLTFGNGLSLSMHTFTTR